MGAKVAEPLEAPSSQVGAPESVEVQLRAARRALAELSRPEERRRLVALPREESRRLAEQQRLAVMPVERRAQVEPPVARVVEAKLTQASSVAEVREAAPVEVQEEWPVELRAAQPVERRSTPLPCSLRSQP